MMRFFNYGIVAIITNLAIYGLEGPLWFTVLFIIMFDFCLFVLFDYISDQDNMYLFSFLISMPFVVYWTETAGAGADENILILLSTIALCVSLPFIFILLFELWNLACEGD